MDTQKVFIGGISPETTKDDIMEALRDYGITSAQIMTTKDTEKPRGFAFAFFDTVESARSVAKKQFIDILVSWSRVDCVTVCHSTLCFRTGRQNAS